MLLMRLPGSSLRPFVRTMWAADPLQSGHRTSSARLREHVLPTGDMHLVFRLSGPPLRLFQTRGDGLGYTVGFAVVGGARSAFYARDVSIATRSVGVQLRPGAAWNLFGMPADELAERHTPLDAIWGVGAAEALERLHAAGSPDAELDCLESLLMERIAPQPRAMHPAVAHALLQLERGMASISELVETSGYSHRHFIALFKDAAGLPPKRLERVLRFQRAIAARTGFGTLADLAIRSGYNDQPHFNRDFLEMTGMTPRAYRRASPSSPNHVRA